MINRIFTKNSAAVIHFLFSEKFCGPSIESIGVPVNKDESKDAAKAGYFAFQHLLKIYIKR